MLTTIVVSNKKPPLLSVSESGGSTSLGLKLAFIGLGFALFAAPNNNAIMSSVEAKFYGIASSILAVMRLTGQAMSMAIVTLLLSIFTANTVGKIYAEHLLSSFKYIFSLFGCLCILALIASLMRDKRA